MYLSGIYTTVSMVLSLQLVESFGLPPTGKGSGDHVTLVTNDTINLRRCNFPEHLHVTVSSPVYQNGFFVSFHLQKQRTSRDFPPTFFIDGFSTRTGVQRPSITKDSMASYSSITNDAHFIFDCSKKSTFTVTGVIMYENEQFIVSPSPDHLQRTRAGSQFIVMLNKLPSTHLSHDYVISEKSRQYNTDILVSSLSENNERQRRDADTYIHDVTTFTIDVMVVVDHNIYGKWLARAKGPDQAVREAFASSEIQRYYMHVIHGVDLRYKNIQFSDFEISVQLSGIVVVDKEIIGLDSRNATEDPPVSSAGTAIEANAALRDFRYWINVTERLPEHDHAILFTGHDLYSTTDDAQVITHTSDEQCGIAVLSGNGEYVRQTDTMQHKKTREGLAFIGTLCESDESLSIVEEQGGFQSIGTAAHEIGHSLGSLHDGENNTCFSEDRYIMAASGFGPTPEDKKYNPWFFSECSVDYFRSFISTLLAEGASCLHQSNKSHVGPTAMPTRGSDVTDAMLLPGQHYSPDEQCRMIWGPESYLCRGAEFGNASTLCTAMYCRDVNSANDCVLHTAARGTSCGNQQWCIRGKCVHSPEAPKQSDACILGDQPGKAFNDLTCEELVKQSPSYCYQDKVKARCCRSCGLHNTLKKGCEFGDRIQGCKHWHCNQYFETRNIQSECCATCEAGVPMTMTRLLATYTTLPPSTAPRYPTVQAEPENSCRDLPEVSGETCPGYIQTHGEFVCYSKSTFNKCCQTCSNLKRNIIGCEYGDRVPSLCDQIVNKTVPYCAAHWTNCCSTCVTKTVPIIMNSATTIGHGPKYVALTIFMTLVLHLSFLQIVNGVR